MSFVREKDTKTSCKLPVKNNELELKVLKAYFIGAIGLTFCDKGEKCGIAMDNDEFDLIQENKFSEAKRRRVDDIMGLIDGEENANSLHDKLPDTPNPPKSATKTQHVGWKHRESCNKPYKQMLVPLGGIKQVILDRRISYPFDEIKQLCLASMKNNYNEHIFKICVFELSNFQEEIFENFLTAKNNNNTDFWDFSNKLKTANSQLKIYVLSTVLDNETTVNTIVENSKPGGSTKKVTAKKVVTSTNIETVKINSGTSKTGNDTKKTSSKGVYTGIVVRYARNTSLNSLEMDQSSKKSSSSSTSNKISEELRFSIPQVNEEDIEFSDTVLGRGAFGTVILAIWNNIDVAVKKIKTPEDRKHIYREINVMDKVRHPNIISIIGVCFTESYIYLLMEYYKSVNLEQFILDRNQELDYELKKNNNYFIALQISQAIAFLHDLNPCVLHKDLKPGNILINDDFIIKICDFGLSQLCDGSSGLETTEDDHIDGTPLYMAPEILLHHSQGGLPADIWALACCIVELFTEKIIWNVEPNNSTQNLKNTVATQKQPCLEVVPLEIHDTMQKCFEHDPVKRPNAAMLVELFKRLFINYKK